MRLENCAAAMTIALAMSCGSAVAGEQTTTVKDASKPMVMSDEQLDQIVGGTDATFQLVIGKFSDAGVFPHLGDKAYSSVVNMFGILVEKAP